jgi:hypothetical protein
MSRKVLVGLCAALSVFALGTMTVGSASGANAVVFQLPAEPLLAIYGWPGANFIGSRGPEQTERPVGQGLGRNFGFGQNMLFQAGGGSPQHAPTGRPLFFEIEAGGAKFRSEACDSFIGGTLMSNRTGVNNPLSFGIEFADFQCNRFGKIAEAGEKPPAALVPAYADTQDQKWIAEICSPEAKKECKADPVIPGSEGQVKIEHVAIEIGPGTTVQGAVYGKWKNGAAGGGRPPCIELKKSESTEPLQNLVVTKSSVFPVGTGVTNVGGEACLISANNDWYQQSEKTEPEIAILNE